ncbi:pilin [Marinomonas dokdonensis]|uniref:pilin n=1 Tax=Marinomonas dokdonensis TaxID=328224 RepID=UPI004055454C
MRNRRLQGGFTLLELMVVIAIISIIASLSAPSFVRQIAKAKLVEAQNIATQHQAIVEEFILINGAFPSSTQFSPLKRTLPDNSVVKSVQVKDNDGMTGHIVISLNADAGIDDGQYFDYQRDSDQNWKCTSDLEQALLPSHCQEIEE